MLLALSHLKKSIIIHEALIKSSLAEILNYLMHDYGEQAYSGSVKHICGNAIYSF